MNLFKMNEKNEKFKINFIIGNNDEIVNLDVNTLNTLNNEIMV